MAKDPAFLFYPNDWLGGTMYMTFEQKGCYLELLMLQFNYGKFSITQVEQVLNKCFSQWEQIKNKFETDGTFFWNSRLADVLEKRHNFSDSRRNNRLGKTKEKQVKNKCFSSVKLMENENINENENGFEEIKIGNGFFLNDFSKDTLLNEIDIAKVVTFIKIKTKFSISSDEICEQWEAFKIDNFDKREWKNSFEDVVQHFRNSLKKQIENNNGKLINSGSGKNGAYSKSDEKFAALRELQ